MNKKLLIALVLGLSSVNASAQTSDKKIEDLERRLSELEAQSSLNTFKFNGTLETRYDHLKSEQTDPGVNGLGINQAFQGNVDYFRLKASLGADADISKYIKFYSKLTMTKYTNVFNTQSVGGGSSPETSQDLYVANDERGAQLYVEKAYADVNVGDSGFVFSFGRLPTSEGPPFQLSKGRPRMGTYPGLLYNAELDGMAVTYGKKFDDQSFAIRAVYSPFTRRTDSAGKSYGEGLLTNPTVYGNSGNTTIDLVTAMAEYSVKNLGWADGVSVIAQAWQIGKLPVNGEEIQLTNNPATVGTTGTSVESKIGNQAIHVDFENLGHVGLDLSYTYLMSRIENNGCIRFAAAGGACRIFGLGASSEGESLSDSSSLIAARYKFLQNDYIGGEYLMGGKNTFVYDTNNETIASFYSTPGTGTHLYLLHKFTPELSLRVGAMEQRYKSTPMTFAASSDTDRKITSYYSTLRLDF